MSQSLVARAVPRALEPNSTTASMPGIEPTTSTAVRLRRSYVVAFIDMCVGEGQGIVARIDEMHVVGRRKCKVRLGDGFRREAAHRSRKAVISPATDQISQIRVKIMAHSMKAEPEHGMSIPDTVPRWKLEDAKARLSELVRKARDEGPQRVTVRGRDAVVVVASDQFDTLQAHAARQSLRDLLANSPLRHLEFGEQGVEGPIRETEL